MAFNEAKVAELVKRSTILSVSTSILGSFMFLFLYPISRVVFCLPSP